MAHPPGAARTDYERIDCATRTVDGALRGTVVRARASCTADDDAPRLFACACALS
jgi:hypothetical protein